MNSIGVMEQYVDRLHTSAAQGDLDTLQAMFKAIPDVDVKNDKGWTALMFAARNGHASAAKALLENGADPSIINSTGQNSLEIAKFWNHAEVMLTLSPGKQTGSVGDSALDYSGQRREVVNFFSRNPLDRAAHKRKDTAWLEAAIKDPKTKFVMFHNLAPVVMMLPEHSVKNLMQKYRLFSANYEQLKTHIESKPLTIFLGLGTSKIIRSQSDDEDDKVSWFAVDISSIPGDKLESFSAHAEILPPFPGLMQIEKDSEAAILAQARSLLAWHDRYQFCPTCGSSTVMADAGYKRTCSKEDCRSNQGVHNTSYPRLDPTVIMAVASPDGKKLLLGRGPRFPKGMFTCLAGFIEPGESLEDACRREVQEESGVKVGRVEYHSCQPWPMPGSLMIGLLAHATNSDIKVDNDELDDARWFNRQDVVLMLTRKHPDHLFCPPEQAIAHRLIQAWVNLTSNL